MDKTIAFFETKRKSCQLRDRIHYEKALSALRMKQRLDDPENYRPCPNCNNDVDIGAQYCSSCGQYVPSLEEE